MPLPDDQQAAIEAILSAIYHLQSPPGPYGKRYYSLIFRDLPDRRDYPDYYLFIKEPRSLNDISASLRQNRYSTPQGVAYDLLLIWSNARQYNQQGSQVYADADTLEQYMKRLWQDRSPPLPSVDSLPRPGSLSATNAPASISTAPDSERKVKRLKLTGASLGSSSTKIRFAAPVPSTSTAAALPAAPQTPTPGITLRLGGKPTISHTAAANAPEAAPLPALPPLALPHLPSQPMNPSTPTQLNMDNNNDVPGRKVLERSTSAVPHRKESKKKGKQSGDPEFEGGEGDSGLHVGSHGVAVPDAESGWLSVDGIHDTNGFYLSILNRLSSQTDASGRILATPLIDLPDRTARPDYYQLINNPVALSTIEAKVNSGQYVDGEAFDRDLSRLFETAKVFIRPESPGTLYGDLLTLQRLYHDLTKRGAGSDAGATAASIKREDGNPSDSQGPRPTARPTTKDKVLLDCIRFKGETLRVGDWIYLSNPQNPGKPTIAQVWQTYRPVDSSQRSLTVCWYYRPEDTVHPVSRQFYENEVFKTGIFTEHAIEDYIGRCFVMFYTRYTRGRPRPPAWTPNIPLYVCEFRYKDDAKVFKKIKSWNTCVPEQIRQHEYDFEPYADEHVDILPKVKSPFVREHEGVGEGESGYNFGQDGVSSATSLPQEATQIPMEFDMQDSQDKPRQIDSLDHVAPLGQLLDASSLAPYGSGIEGADPTLAGTSTPGPAELDTASFFTPLPSALKSKFRNTALGDLLWFGAPAIVPPVASKPTHSLAYLYWRAKQQQGAGSA